LLSKIQFFSRVSSLLFVIAVPLSPLFQSEEGICTGDDSVGGKFFQTLSRSAPFFAVLSCFPPSLACRTIFPLSISKAEKFKFSHSSSSVAVFLPPRTLIDPRDCFFSPPRQFSFLVYSFRSVAILLTFFFPFSVFLFFLLSLK